MDFNAMNGPKMTEEQIAEYFERIGIEGSIGKDIEGLTALHQAHQQSIPFENLDLVAGIPLSLEHEDLFDKMIRRHRGGVCSELNTLYNWLLYSLGFDVTSYNTRITSPEFIQFRRHRALGVKLDGKLYITDVGSNWEYIHRPLLLEEGLVQSDGTAEHRYVRHEFFGWLYEKKSPSDEDFVPQYGFTLEPQIDLDFVTPTFYFEKHPDSKLNKLPRVSLYNKEGMIAMRNHRFTVERGRVAIEKKEIEDWEEEKRILKEVFHLDADML